MNEAALLVGFILWFAGIVASIFLADTKDRSVGGWLLVAALLPVLSVAVLVMMSNRAHAYAIAACIPAITPVLLALLPRAGAADPRPRQIAIEVAS